MDTPSPAVQKRRGRSILVVGNKTREMFSISLLLQKFEYEVAAAGTVAEALELVKPIVPALIITDLALSDMTGLDLMNLLRREKRTASVPVVFAVPLSDAAAERRCLDAGAAACISKPVLAENLYRTVQAIIEIRPRENMRIETRLPVSLNNVPICSEGLCDVDLSEHGMYVPMDKPYIRNRRLKVQISIKDRLISTDSAVLYSHASAVGPHRVPGMGLKFLDIAPQDREFIRTYIRDEVTRDVKAAISSGPVEFR